MESAYFLQCGCGLLSLRLGGVGFSLRGLVLAGPKTHKLKPAPRFVYFCGHGTIMGIRRRKRSMIETVVDTLILDLLEWLTSGERSYRELIDVWGTSCPKPVWEDARDRGCVAREFQRARSCQANFRRFDFSSTTKSFPKTRRLPARLISSVDLIAAGAVSC